MERTLHSIAHARGTEVYDTFWQFAAERQAIFFRRVCGSSGPWTNNPVLSSYKFTNAYRASDRVSQYLIRNVIYRRDLPDSTPEVFFRILLFKLFNKIETWQRLEHSLGPLTYSAYRFSDYDRVLEEALNSSARIYSAAYIMPPGKMVFGRTRKHQNHLLLLDHMMKTGLPAIVERANSMQDAFQAMRSYDTIGDFLAYQFITDINYSEITDFGEMDFVVAGPGAKDGLRKCFSDYGGLNDAELIRVVADLQEQEFERLGLPFQTLWGRRLQLIDCQNLFCETGKYARIAHPHMEGIGGRKRIKQKFAPTDGGIELFYPPKWKINERIRQSGLSPKSLCLMPEASHCI